MKFNVWLCITAAALLTACASHGVQVSQEAAMQFTEGKTTETEIVAKLGTPSSTTYMSGMKFISYTGVQMQATPATFIPVVGVLVGGTRSQFSMVQYQIDKDGVMQKMMYTGGSSGTDAGRTVTTPMMEAPRAVQ